MSIVLAAAGNSPSSELPSAWVLVGLGLWLVIGAAAAVHLGVLRAGGVLGPERLGPHESPWAFLLLNLGGVFVAWTLTAFAAGILGAQPQGARQGIMLGLVLYMLPFAVLVGLNGAVRPGGLTRLGLIGRGGVTSGFGAGLLWLVLVLPLVYVLEVAVAGLWEARGWPLPPPHPVLEELSRTADWRLVTLLVTTAVVAAPLFEELVFRGVLQTFLARLLAGPTTSRSRGFEVIVPPAPGAPAPAAPPIAPDGDATEAAVAAPGRQAPAQAVPRIADGRAVAGRWIAVAVTSLLFALVHGHLAFVPPLFLLSVALGYVYERTGNLWANITMHALFNGSQIVLFMLIGL